MLKQESIDMPVTCAHMLRTKTGNCNKCMDFVIAGVVYYKQRGEAEWFNCHEGATLINHKQTIVQVACTTYTDTL